MTPSASQTPETFLYDNTHVLWVFSESTKKFETSHSLLRQQATDLELRFLANNVVPTRMITNDFTDGIPREKLSLTQAEVTQLQEKGFYNAVHQVVRDGIVVDRRKEIRDGWIKMAARFSH